MLDLTSCSGQTAQE
ncbi:hypothetical protein PENNAL_c0443G03747, partial [Penicillium nalgiovense]